jgi:hypothetical protein
MLLIYFKNNQKNIDSKTCKLITNPRKIHLNTKESSLDLNDYFESLNDCCLVCDPSKGLCISRL